MGEGRCDQYATHDDPVAARLAYCWWLCGGTALALVEPPPLCWSPPSLCCSTFLPLSFASGRFMRSLVLTLVSGFITLHPGQFCFCWWRPRQVMIGSKPATAVASFAISEPVEKVCDEDWSPFGHMPALHGAGDRPCNLYAILPIDRGGQGRTRAWRRGRCGEPQWILPRCGEGEGGSEGGAEEGILRVIPWRPFPRRPRWRHETRGWSRSRAGSKFVLSTRGTRRRRPRGRCASTARRCTAPSPMPGRRRYQRR